MRKLLFKIAWKLHLRTLAYYIYPSLYFVCDVSEFLIRKGIPLSNELKEYIKDYE